MKGILAGVSIMAVAVLLSSKLQSQPLPARTMAQTLPVLIGQYNC